MSSNFTLLGERPLRRLAKLLPLLVLGGGFGGQAFTSWHLPRVTGRADVPIRNCFYCHRLVGPPLRADRPAAARWASPAGLALAPDGGRLYVAAEGSDRLLEVDLSSRAVTRSVALTGRPHGVAVSADGATLAVTSRDGDRLRLIDRATLTERAALATGYEPFAVALAPGGSEAWVANGASDDVSLHDLVAGGPPRLRLAAGREPYALALSRDGNLLAVTSRLALLTGPDEIPRSEVTLIEPLSRRVRDRRELVSAHLSEGIALSSDASFALASVIRVRNLLPITEVERGTVMNSALAWIDTAAGGRTVQLPLDEVNAYWADPAGVAITPDDRLAFVAASGARAVTVVDLVAMRELVRGASAEELAAMEDDLATGVRYIRARIPTRDNPRAMAMAPDGRRLYVSERLADSIAVIDTTRLEVVDRIELGRERRLDRERRGEIVFHDATVTFQGQFSCRSCHPDGNSDGLSYDFVIDGVGLNRVENRSLRDIRHTAPYKWNGGNPDLATQCGPRFAKVLTRSDPFPPDQLADLVAYIESIPLPARRAPDASAEAVARGRALFERTRTRTGQEIPKVSRCTTCHRPPLYTDRLRADIGSKGPLDTQAQFDTPHLLDLRSTAPYLHDGRARSLEEIWTVFNPKDTHGMTNDLSKPELNDLITYLRTL